MSELRKVRPSLLERAAEVYDFDAHLRARNAPIEPIEAPSVAVAMPDDSVDRAASPYLAQPAVPATMLQIDRKLLAEQGLLVPGAPADALVEEFRQVKRQLMITARTIRLQDADKARTILVCSANADEGKTYCAVNLAISLAAERDTQVLLVDADVAKPDVMRWLGGSDGPGLLDALADPAIDVENCVVGTDIPQLSLLPAGTKSNTDTELLASDRTHRLIGKLLAADPTRIVIFDSPPALAASPASVVAGEIGQVILVVRADKTGESDLRDAVTQLDGCEHIQLVLNAVSYAPGGRRFGSYYGQDDAT
ncbi:AAA family ATPase [Sphingomonas sp. PB4P5]|uniref:AAA family ATPase n=1 Tax=Parasphingomonas puruogangriensis TaxID=3096155 RepID=UPI002FCADAD9